MRRLLIILAMVLLVGAAPVRNIFVGMSDDFQTREHAIENDDKITLVGCENIKQHLLVTDDTVVLTYPNDSLRQPLIGKAVNLVNNNRTLICEAINGEIFSLTYYIDPLDTTGVSPILILKRPLIKQTFFLSHTKECEKLKNYLSN